jgi:hypothetical protein
MDSHLVHRGVRACFYYCAGVRIAGLQHSIVGVLAEIRRAETDGEQFCIL